jgi:hypothetical protein
METLSLEAYLKELDFRLRRYIPPANDWTPVEKAIFQPSDPYRVELKTAEVMQFEAIRFAFQHHFEHNRMYRNFCIDHGVYPTDLRRTEDLEKIPLIPDQFFKEHPSGRDFASWIANIFTGELPKINISQSQPNFEQVIQAFNAAGLVITYSSGTSGHQTVIPRDRRTYNLSEYMLSKSAIAMTYPQWQYNMSGYLLMPNPYKTNLYAGKVCQVYFDAIDDITVAIDQQISAKYIRMTMNNEKGIQPTLIRLLSHMASIRMINRIIDWLEKHQKTDRKITFVGAPYLVWSVLNRLKRQGRGFDFSHRGGIITGGGWKIFEGQRLSTAEFRRQAQELLCFSPEFCLDVYGMVEGNGWMVQCPEGHYLHVPYTYYKGMVLDKYFKPQPYGEWGRFAFLDSSALSYPGFIISGDMVRMLEHCPICDRPGPVLEPEIRRASGEDMRGCSEEVRRMFTADIGG